MRFAIYDGNTFNTVTYFDADDFNDADDYFAEFKTAYKGDAKALRLECVPDMSADDVIRDIYKMAGTLD